MSNEVRDALEQLDELDDWTDYDNTDTTEAEKAFAGDIFTFRQAEINSGCKNINEEFTGRQNSNIHFDIHCLGGKNVKNKNNDVAYDFQDISKYVEYERVVNQKVRNPNVYVASLLDTETVIKAFHKLFEGNKSILFGVTCGFENDEGPVMFGMTSFANSATTNYAGGNTINFDIVDTKFKTMTLYPVKADRVETRFNGIIHKYTKLDISEFKFNR